MKSDEKIILKLHKQFAHPAPEKLKKLLVSAGRGKNFLDIVDQVSKNCEICQKFKRRYSTQTSGMSAPGINI